MQRYLYADHAYASIPLALRLADGRTVTLPRAATAADWLALGGTIEEVTIPLGVLVDAKLTAIRSQAEEHILTAYPAWRQRNAALGIEPDAETMATDISAVRVESDRCEDLAGNATNEAELDAIVPIFPTIGA